jgi:hypothetical protein
MGAFCIGLRVPDTSGGIAYTYGTLVTVVLKTEIHPYQHYKLYGDGEFYDLSKDRLAKNSFILEGTEGKPGHRLLKIG